MRADAPRDVSPPTAPAVQVTATVEVTTDSGRTTRPCASSAVPDGPVPPPLRDRTQAVVLAYESGFVAPDSESGPGGS